jgi:hypothetical protein
LIVEALADPESVAIRAAALIAVDARAASAARGRYVMAVSGGHTPWLMLRAFGKEDVPWKGYVRAERIGYWVLQELGKQTLTGGQITGLREAANVQKRTVGSA